MIPKIFVEQWRTKAQWQSPDQVEQDLVISKALVCLYKDPHVASHLVFRGGTALNKIFITPPSRYSEDIDFVQKEPGPIGYTIDKVRELMQPWLGPQKSKITERGAKLIYQYQTLQGLKAKLKIEINTTEHFQVLPITHKTFSVESEWFSGSCEICTYTIEELMATKLRALYQRRKGRDLFDVWYVLKSNLCDTQKVIEIFEKYCAKDGRMISKALFSENMALKKENKDFQIDMDVLLPHQTYWNFNEAFSFVQDKIIYNLSF